MALVASGVGAIHLGVRRDEPPWRQPVGRMPQIDPDQDAALRRLRAAFGFVEVLEVVDHRYARRRTAQGKTSKEVIRCLIGGLSRSRLEVGPWLLGERQGTASLPCRTTASFSSAAPDARRGPVTGVRDMPDPGPNNETPAAGLDTVESTPAPRRRPA